jgi:hypothetical protein
MNYSLTLLLLAALAAFAPITRAVDPPPSGTNTLAGLVRFTNADPDILARLGPPENEGVTSLSIFAYTDPPEVLQSSKTFSGADPVSNPYSLTVAANDVPLTYNVYGYLALDGNHEEYWTATRAAAPLTSNSPPATLDLDECIALLELRYVDSAGQPVAALGGRALVTETGPPYAWRARYLTQPPGRTGNFLVAPSGVEFELAVEVDTGTDIYLDRLTHRETRIFTYACDEKPVLTITIPDAGTLGRITGSANLVGEIEFATEGYQELLGRPVIKARGPSGNQRYAALAGESPGGDANRPFALENLVPSTATESWRVQAEMHFGDGQRFEYFISPALGQGVNPGVEVTAGNTTDLGDAFVMNPARLVGRLTLSGPPEFAGSLSALRGLVRSSDYDADMDGIPDGIGSAGIGGSYVIATGTDELAPGATHSAVGGQATASFAGAFNPATAAFEGDYEAVVGMLNDQPGIWKYDGLNLGLEHRGTNGGPFVSQTLYIVESEPWRGTLAPGERATNDVRYGFAEVCLRIRSPLRFFYPRVINSYGGLTNLDSTGVFRSYSAVLGNASAPPYSADAATNEAIVTMYLPEGSYTLQPAFSAVDPDGGVSDVQLPTIQISVTARERLCIEDCLRIVLTGPTCATNFGFLMLADAFSCDSTLTNLSLTTRPVDFPGVRLGYSDIRILEPVGIPRATLRTGHGLFPEFDGYADHPEYYSNIVWIAEARDTRGRVARREFYGRFDFTPPPLNCTNILVPSGNGIDAVVDYGLTAPSGGSLFCTPPSGSTFTIGVTPVNCLVRDVCRNTNTCSFTVTVRGPDEDCALRIALTQLSPPEVTLTWDCAATLQGAETLDGPWTTIDGATSPYPTPADGPHKFFRLCISGDCSGIAASRPGRASNAGRR